VADADPLAPFSPAVRAWFETSFPEATPPQAKGWPAIAEGHHSLILAPTGSGKTLAAFLWAIDRLVSHPTPAEATHRTRLLYVSPLRALAVDVEKNLRSPLQGIRLAAERLGVPYTEPTVGMRTGDTPSDERRKLVRYPPDILITTPESLYLMLTSAARETLRGVEAVIIDEIHAMAATKRGSHLALTLERLDHWVRSGGAPSPQRIGLSATQRPLEEIARFLGGTELDGPTRAPRPVAIVDAGVRKPLEIEVVIPIDDMATLGQVVDEPTSGPAAAGPARRSIWPAMHPRLLELVLEHRSTLIFVNARRLAERLATRLNELHWEGESRGGEQEGRPPDAPELVKAHHGSLSREKRLEIEDDLKSGRLKGLVATSSLELGIDMGAVDLVVQVASPGRVSTGLQRVGRAGHQVGAPSRGKVFPKHRADLLETAVVVERMQSGQIEETHYPRNPLDVLCQQVVAMCALDDWPVDELTAVVRSAAPFAELSDEVLGSVLDLLSGRYPSEEFAELRPRLVWDRVAGVLRGRAGAQRLAVTNPGTIPDRGLFTVTLPDGTRVGELDEEMVYESRPGETFLLGATTWRIEDITFQKVVVTPAPGVPGKMPFWHGDGPGRPLELGRAMGAFTRELRAGKGGDEARARLAASGLDERAAANLVAYLDEQAEATGAVPDDRTIVVERFRDEIGDWRVCVLSPFGAQVHAPWAMALQHRLTERWGMAVEMMWSDDGIAIRLPESVDELLEEELLLDPDEVGEILMAQLPSTAMFASRFRECAGRALLLPKRRPDQRTPLWQQRQRSADLLSVAGKYPSFPILLEATRECLNDVFDVPALVEVLRDLRSRKVRLVPVDTRQASPFAQSLLFGWIAVYMYEGDAPLAERRAAALALDRDLLRDLLGAEELRELIDGDVLAELELELQRLVPGRQARDCDELHDLLRQLGPLSFAELAARVADGQAVAGWVDQLVGERRAFVGRIAGEERVAAAEDAGRLRDALGVAVPIGLPAVCTESVPAPLLDLVTRYARTHGPFLTQHPAARYGVGGDAVRAALETLVGEGRVVRGEFRPDGVEREWCDDDVLRQLRRRSLAALRREVEPVDAGTLARFLPRWHGVGAGRRGMGALEEVIGQLQGAPLVASALERDVLGARLPIDEVSGLDGLCTSGEVVWVGAGAIGSRDGRIRLAFRDQAGLLLPEGEGVEDPSALHTALLDHLEGRGASFWSDLTRAAQVADQPYDDPTVLAALWDLVWAGLVTNDSLAPLRAFVGGTGRRPSAKSSPRSRPRPGRLARLGPPAGAGRWSLVAPLLEPRPTATEAAHARALQLLERYGVLTREAALGEGAEGGFAGVYPVLKALEERGQVRRGYFVAGLGAAQFAVPGAVDRLRGERESALADDEASPPVVLAATDPAQPFGAALPWPDTDGRPQWAAGALVVLAAGEALAYLERGAHTLVRFPAGVHDDRWAAALGGLVDTGRFRVLELRTIDGQSVHEAPPEVRTSLERAGFKSAYKGWTRRPARG
jgi:ATP-dependent Lhr-like helicase